MPLIKRQITAEIKAHLSKKEITLITGARQVGKTTLLHEIKKDLQKEGKRVLFLNLDIDSHAPYFKSQELLLSKIDLEIGSSGFVFIDEIQRLQDAGLFLKGLYDRQTNYKFVVTGSGSIELKEHIHESLIGRKRLFEMAPVNFGEFVNYKTDYRYEDKLNAFFEIEPDKTDILLNEYLNFGGYPAMIKESKQSEKNDVLNEIFKSYIEKDLVYLLNIERPQSFEMLMKLLAAQSGTMINYGSLASQCGISVPTLKKYLWYAEKTFSVHYVPPFFTNPVKEISKSPVYYFNDLGMRNYALNMVGNLTLPSQLGFVFQNLVHNTLKNMPSQVNPNIRFWRTTDKAEVDFVIGQPDNPIPVEVKYSDMKRPEISRSFHSFIDKYNPKKAFLVTRRYNSVFKIKNTDIHCISFPSFFTASNPLIS